MREVLKRLCKAFVIVLLLVVVVACSTSALERRATTQAATIPVQDYNFGNVQVGKTSPPRSFTITSISPTAGPQDDLIDGITEGCPDFDVMAPGLPTRVTSSCTKFGGAGYGGTGTAECIESVAKSFSFTAVFMPLVTQAVSCVVTVKINGAATTFTVFGRGIEPPIRIAVSPSSALGPLDLGEVRVGETSGAAAVTVRNFGSGPQSMRILSVSFDPASVTRGFAIASGTTTAHLVAPNGGTDPYSVTCSPTTTGAVLGTLTIKSDDPATPTSTINFRCTGIISNLVFLPVSPAMLAGAQAQGATRVGEPIDIPITLVNYGDASLVINQLTVSGAQLSIVSGPSADMTLARNETAGIVIRFAATTAVAQGVLGTLTVTHDTDELRSINVIGAALETSMSITPDGSVDLGPICVGATASQEFFVRKNNPGSFVITGVEQPAAPFLLTGTFPTTGSPIQIDTGFFEFKVQATPIAPGKLASALTVTTDIPGGQPRSIMLAATGLPAGITPTPKKLDLGVVSVASTSVGQMVTLTNCNGAPLTLIHSEIIGVNRDDFTIALQPTDPMLPDGMSATYVVVMGPHNSGTLNATLVIDHDEGSVEIPLLGAGTGGIIDEVLPAPGTYYSCSTGLGTGGWPVGIVGLLLLRRRRRS